MSDVPAGYVTSAEKLRDRILKMIPEHPEILTLDGPWGLFKVPGFQCHDLGPSLAQASWALDAAKRDYAAVMARS